MEWLNSALIAGAVGATLAILGNFVVQRTAARRDHRRYVARLAAEFMAADASLVFNLSQERLEGPAEEGVALIGPEGHMQTIQRASTELSIVAPSRVAYLAQVIAGHSNALMVQSFASDAATYRASILDHGAARLAFLQAMRRFTGAGRMTDDQLGHDAIDPVEPSSTHTPQSTPR